MQNEQTRKPRNSNRIKPRKVHFHYENGNDNEYNNDIFNRNKLAFNMENELTFNMEANISKDKDIRSKDLDVNVNNDSVNNDSVNKTIYRYKFKEDTLSELYTFAKIHEFDDRPDFKTAWEEWLDENNDLVKEEAVRLTDLGYSGNIINKMYISVRYYLRKKTTEKREPRKRRNYTGLTRLLLDSMDNHIKESIKDVHYKPSNGFNDYCINNEELLKMEMETVMEKYNSSSITDEIKAKIKKTYKNRYFMLQNK
jgi:hypothetical protein